MSKHLNKKVLVRAVVALVVGFGITAVAPTVGTQMKKVPSLDRIGLLIKVLE